MLNAFDADDFNANTINVVNEIYLYVANAIATNIITNVILILLYTAATLLM